PVDEERVDRVPAAGVLRRRNGQLSSSKSWGRCKHSRRQSGSHENGFKSFSYHCFPLWVSLSFYGSGGFSYKMSGCDLTVAIDRRLVIDPACGTWNFPLQCWPFGPCSGVSNWHSRQKPLRVRVRWGFENLLARAKLHDLTKIEHRDAM